jgi:hypothetical protein
MRHRGIPSFSALLLAISVSAHADPADDEALSIVHLAFRDQIVTIASSPQGLRYSVHTTSGKLLGENLTDDQLLAAHPKLHSHIRSSYASDESGSIIWAGQSESLTEPAEDAVNNPD